MEGVGCDSVAGFSFGDEVCILQRFGGLPLPCRIMDIQNIGGVVCFCATLESALSGHWIRSAGLIVM